MVMHNDFVALGAELCQFLDVFCNVSDGKVMPKPIPSLKKVEHHIVKNLHVCLSFSSISNDAHK